MFLHLLLSFFDIVVVMTNIFEMNDVNDVLLDLFKEKK